jgi:hypothetical protein
MHAPSLLMISLALVGADGKPKDLNARVLAFCKKHVGETIGRGECATLVEEAYKRAGARPWQRYKQNPSKYDYVWGLLVYKLEAKAGKQKEALRKGYAIRPGDVIQFRNAFFQGKRGGGFYRLIIPHHTAVVADVSKDGKTIEVIHQNIGGRRFVQTDTLRLGDLNEGWLRFYQPIPR